MKKNVVIFTAIFAAIMLALPYCLQNNLYLYIILAALLAILAILICTKKYSIIYLVLTACALSITWQLVYFHITKTPEWILDKNVKISSVVSDFPTQNSKGTGVIVKTVIDTVDGKRLDRKIRAILYLSDPNVHFRPGGRLGINAELQIPENDKDFAGLTYYKTRYIDVLGFAKPPYTYANSAAISVRYFPAYLINIIKVQIDKLFPPPQSALLRALITGDSSELDIKFSEDLRITGLSHTIAVSGMHIAILVAFITLIIGKRRSIFISVPVIILFALMVGATPSVLRAVIMQISILSAPLLKRESDSLSALMFSLLLILILNPYAVGDIGLSLSFFATLGLVLFSGKINRRLCSRLNIKNGFLRSIVNCFIVSLDTTLAATLFTIPILALSFKSVSLISPVSNVLLVFIINFIFILGMIAVFISFISFWIGHLGAVLITLICKAIEFTVSFMAQIPFASVYTGNAYIAALIIYLYIIIVILLLSKRDKIRKVFPVTLSILAVILVILLCSIPSQKHSGLKVTVLDVGQGECVVADLKGTRVFIDCGGNKSRNAGDIAYQYLKSNYSRKAEALVLTHLHSDHINGVERLLGKVNIKQLYLPEKDKNTSVCNRIISLALKRGTQVHYVSKDQTVGFGDMKINLYCTQLVNDENESGIAALIRFDNFETLITGDIGGKTEKLLTSKRKLPDVEAYVAGHHGSKSSSSLNLLDKILPKLTVISVGENSYGHPNEETLLRLEKLGTTIIRTDLQGSVTFYSDEFRN